MAAADDPITNRLLAALPAADFERLRPDLERVDLPLGKVLFEPGSPMRHAWFPTTAIVSMVTLMEDGHTAETAVVGSEGMIGVSLLLGGDAMPVRSAVQSAGAAWRIERERVIREFVQAGALQRLILRYTQALVTQVMQTAACNRHHTVDQQLCRWLLLALDRAGSDELRMTQELIAEMLGVRRGGVTEAAGRLQTAGLIRYSRGLIQVLDRPGLEARVCECYAVVKTEYARLLPGSPARQAG